MKSTLLFLVVTLLLVSSYVVLPAAGERYGEYERGRGGGEYRREEYGHRGGNEGGRGHEGGRRNEYERREG